MQTTISKFTQREKGSLFDDSNFNNNAEEKKRKLNLKIEHSTRIKRSTTRKAERFTQIRE